MPSDKSLQKAMNGFPAQTYHKDASSYKETHGSDNAAHMKVTDPNTGEPIDPREVTFPEDMNVDVVKELESVKAELQALKEHTFNTRLSGSKDEYALPTKQVGTNVNFKREIFPFDLLEVDEMQTQTIKPPEDKRWRIKFVGASVRSSGDSGYIHVWIRYGSNQAQNQILSIRGSNEAGAVEIQGNVVSLGEVREGPQEEVAQSMALSLLLADETEFQIACQNGTNGKLSRASITIVYEEES